MTTESRTDNKLSNIARYLPKVALETPHKTAIIFPYGRDTNNRVSYTLWNFNQLNQESDRYAWGFKDLGIVRGDKISLMVRPCLEFVALTFALFKLGAIPVLIDPGMGNKNMLNCIRQVEPEGFIAIPLAHVLRILNPGTFSSVKHIVTAGRRWFWGGETLGSLRSENNNPFPVASTASDETAAILFTSGSTGPAKGVVYFHGQMEAQVNLIKERFEINKSDIDMPVFPLFALFSAAFGITAVIPDMDPTKPSQVDPEKLVEAIQTFGVTYSFGSPAIWKRLADHCQTNHITLPSFKRILLAGAPVPPTTLEIFKSVLTHGDTYTPYGATESLPVACISGSEIIEKTRQKTDVGGGTCVGTAFNKVTIQIIKPVEGVIENWELAKKLPPGEIGEIVVKGPIVTKKYFKKREATAAAKILDGTSYWHRMGDMGYLDDSQRLWFCGRKAHRVITDKKIFYSVCCEAVFNTHQDIFRTALVGITIKNKIHPAIIVELSQSEKKPKLEIIPPWILEWLQQTATSHEHTSEINHFMIHPAFPVDVRHNAKIFREKLAVWAQQKFNLGLLKS